VLFWSVSRFNNFKGGIVEQHQGGMREESRIEFYIPPNDWQPPAPQPAVYAKEMASLDH
jgi:hypothetical protein